MKIRLRTDLVRLLAILSAARLLSAATVYTNESDFLSALGPAASYLNDFNELPAAAYQYAHPLNYASNGFAYSITSLPLFQIQPLAGAVCTAGSGDLIHLSVTSGSATAIGGWFSLTDSTGAPTNGALSLILSDGTTNSFACSGSIPPNFLGFITSGSAYVNLMLRSDTAEAYPTLDHLYTAGPPVMSAIPAGPSSIRISWPALASGYVLQSTTDPTGTNWSTAATLLNPTNGNVQVDVPVTNSSAYYRLKQL